MSSRVTGPERYLTAFGFRAGSPETAAVKKALARSQNFADGASPLTMPLLTPVVSLASLARDSTFMEGATAMSTLLCERQGIAVEAVVDRAQFLEEMAMQVSDAVPEGNALPRWPLFPSA